MRAHSHPLDAIRSFGELLDEPLQFVRQHWKPMLAIALPGRLLMALPATINQIAVNQAADDPALMLGLMGGTMIVVAITYALAGWLVLVEYRMVRALLDGRSPSPWECYREGLRPGPFVVVALLSMCMGFGLACMVVPGLICGTLLGLFVATWMAEQDRGLGSAIRHSLELFTPTRGRWGLIGLGMGMATAEWLLLLAMGGITGIPGMIYGGLAGWRAAASGGALTTADLVPAWVVVVQQIGGALTAVPIDMYAAAGFTLLYHHARASREGTDLVRRLEDRLAGEST